MDKVTFYLLLVTILVVLQGVLWAWISMQAKDVVSWWPFMREEEPTRYDNSGRYSR